MKDLQQLAVEWQLHRQAGFWDDNRTEDVLTAVSPLPRHSPRPLPSTVTKYARCTWPSFDRPSTRTPGCARPGLSPVPFFSRSSHSLSAPLPIAQTLYRFMKDGSRSVSGPALDREASEGPAAGTDSLFLDDTPQPGARGATTEWTKAFTGGRVAGSGGDRIADHAYGGDLFSQRGDYQEGKWRPPHALVG